MTNYGKELVLDLHECDPTTFNRPYITNYFKTLCELIDMERADLHFWDDVGVPEEDKQTEPHLVGTSAIQFITTSNITIHTLDIMKRVYLNIFSCKDFHPSVVEQFTLESFGGKIMQARTMDRI